MATHQTPLREVVASNVRGLLEERDLTTVWLIGETGIAPRTLHRRLTGKSDWTTDELDAVLAALDLTHASDLTSPRHALRVAT